MSNLVIEPELLESLYWGNDYTMYQIGNIFDCSDVTICRRMTEYDIPSRDHKLSDFTFDARQREIFEGCMLGDGYLQWCTSNCYFGNVDKHKEYLICLQKYIGVEEISNIDDIYYFKGAGEPCEHMLRTKVIPSIRDEYKRWYPYDTKHGTNQNRNYKVIPKDIDLTLMKVLFWYIGDGSYRKDYGDVTFTNSLILDDAKLLISKLKVLLDVDDGITYQKRGINSNNNRVYRIRLSRVVSDKFFDMVNELGIGIPECYDYKFGG